MAGLRGQQQGHLGDHAEAVGMLGPAADQRLLLPTAFCCDAEAGLLGLAAAGEDGLHQLHNAVPCVLLPFVGEPSGDSCGGVLP